MASCTSGVKALRPSRSAQGSYYFLNLHCGKNIIHNNWTVFSMTNEVINTIHQLAATCKKYKGITFTDKDGNINNDENDNSEDNIEITGVNDETYSPNKENYSPPSEITVVDDKSYCPNEEIYSPNKDSYSLAHSKTTSPQDWDRIGTGL